MLIIAVLPAFSDMLFDIDQSRAAWTVEVIFSASKLFYISWIYDVVCEMTSKPRYVGERYQTKQGKLTKNMVPYVYNTKVSKDTR